MTEVKWSESSSAMSDSLWPHGLYTPWNSLGQNTGMGSLSLLQGIFPTQGSNPGVPYCRRVLYQLSHKGSPRILEWVAYPFCSTAFQKHQSFGTQLSLHCNSHIRIWLLENHIFDYMDFVGKLMSLLLNRLSRFVRAFLPRRKCL